MKKINFEKTKGNMAIINKRAWLKKKLSEHPDDAQIDAHILAMLLGGYYTPAGRIGQQLIKYLREDGYLVEEDDQAA